jgi:hypothetical protein
MIRSQPEPESSSDEDDDDKDKDKNDQAESNTTKTDETPTGSASTTPLRPPENTSDTAYPVCWFEDEETQTALRWHLFAGVLHDMKRKHAPSIAGPNTATTLPWKIRLHFTAYPSTEILPLQADTTVLLQVQGFFKNSLKQALCLLHGNSKAAMNLTKESHGRLWRAVETANFSIYNQVVCQDLPAVSRQGVSIAPVRLYVNAKPPIQRPCWDVTMSLGALLAEWLPDHFTSSPSVETEGENAENAEKADCEENEEETMNTSACVPAIPKVACQANETVACWRVGGIQPSLDHSILDLWKTLSHPDHFLYVVVITKSL